ncbi:MAG TPA: septum formation family protein [Marmoricola sp.]|nr:septum formation family protein [Marmoricola sp.]
MGTRTAVLLAVVVLAGACSDPVRPDSEADKLTAPKVRTCRDLTADDLDRPTNTSKVVPCSAKHTAETFAVGTLPASTGSTYRDRRHGTYVFDTCTKAFQGFLGVDESLAMRIRLSWAWFGPSERGWQRGARWYRCDVVGGPGDAKELRDLPTVTRGLFAARQPDEWLACARGTTVVGSSKVPCSDPHDWRAVTTIKVGLPDDPYPGDRIVEVRSRDRCRSWLNAWLHYPGDYDYGYTWFHEAEWSTGNRRSICWMRTDK